VPAALRGGQNAARWARTRSLHPYIMTGPLSHIRVLDLSRIMAGPWSSQILADLGADVIKVERPGTGDDTRTWGPPFLRAANGEETPDAGYFMAVNRGKRSITLELDKAAGQRAVRTLAAQCDIVVENFKAGTLARYGLGYEDLKRENAKLIYCSITGFGQTGPRRDIAAYDFMIQAMGGLMSVTGEADGKPGGGPQKVGVPVVDIMTGMYATVAILAALARREVTGHGDAIDIAMLDVQTAVLANQGMNFLLSGKPPRRAGNAHPNIQPQDVFACRDGHLTIVVGNDAQFVKFCDVIGHPELARDPKFATNRERVRNLDALNPVIVAALRERDLRDWIAALERAGVPCGPINTIPMVFDDPQIQHRKMLRELPHPVAGSVPTIASPINYKEATLSYDRPPPMLGEHRAEIIREFGLELGADPEREA
jgi:crotonobetainyl-CoA:carnitine CoA-transferase CaiB-like acyl-CoA transferase